MASGGLNKLLRMPTLNFTIAAIVFGKNVLTYMRQKIKDMGIKSFMGKRSKVMEAPTNIKVSDYMTRNLITFRPEQHVMEVMEKLIKISIRNIYLRKSIVVFHRSIFHSSFYGLYNFIT